MYITFNIKTFKKAALAIMLMLPILTVAQNSSFGNWLIYFGNKQLSSKWNIHNEAQYRNYNAIGDLEQLLLRTGLGYNLTDNNNNILLGYAYILSENYVVEADDKFSVNEHRIFQQFITKQSVGRVKLNHRYRFEQRFIEDDFRMRFRYFLGINIPINKNESNRYYLSAYNEIFVNTEKAIFDRNRLFGGLGYNINESIRIEVGYMNQFFEIGSRDQINVMTFVKF